MFYVERARYLQRAVGFVLEVWRFGRSNILKIQILALAKVSDHTLIQLFNLTQSYLSKWLPPKPGFKARIYVYKSTWPVSNISSSLVYGFMDISHLIPAFLQPLPFHCYNRGYINLFHCSSFCHRPNVSNWSINAC